MSKNIIIPADLDTTKGHKFNAVSKKWEINKAYLLGEPKVYPLVKLSENITVLPEKGSIIRNYLIVRNGQGWVHLDFIPNKTWWKGAKKNTPIFKLPANAPDIFGLVESNVSLGTNLGGIKNTQVWTFDKWNKGKIFINKFTGILSNTDNERRVNINLPCMVTV